MASQRLSFYDEIKKNKRHSNLLVGVVMLVLLLLVYVIAMVVGTDYFFFILIAGTIISVLYVVCGYYKSAQLALVSVNAKPASETQYRQYHHLVEGLALASGLPKPKLYVMNNSQINAFASGRDPQNAIICVTTGALEKLNNQELEGVLAHEMSHIANYDIRFMTLTAVLVGMISIISQIFIRSLWFGSMTNGRDNNKGKAIFLIIGVVLAILAPIITSLVQLAISRRREYVADSSAVKFMRTPTGLIGALKKIKSNSPMKVSGAVAPLFLAKPNKSREIFMTHPPLEKRIERLESM
ncbi:MAG: M48 family metallopeptidase [Candidatus Pacearchaeota archaeon]